MAQGSNDTAITDLSEVVSKEETMRDIWQNINDASTAYGDISVVDRTNIFDYSSAYAVSSERDIISAPNGSVTNSGGEYDIHNNAAPSATTSMETAELGLYVPDYEGVAGIAIRRPSAPTGGRVARFGYYNGVDGAYFGEDSTGVFVSRMVNGTEVDKVYQDNWNADVVDGSGNKNNPSGLELDLSEGIICHVRLALYNFGRITYELYLRNSKNKLVKVIVHRTGPRGEVTLRSQNLPISIYLDNNSTASAFDYYVDGRQYSIKGSYTGERRVKGDRRPNPSNTTVSVSSSSWTPIIAFKRKTDFHSKQVKLRLFSYSINSSVDAYIQVRINATVSGGSYGTPTNVSPSETAIQDNTGVTGVAINDGIQQYQDFVKGGQGSHTSLTQGSGVNVHINRDQVAVMAIKGVSSSGTVSAASVQWEELW